MNHLRPFLHNLVAKGNILFLCDGLNEIDEKYRSSVNVEFAEMMAQNQNQLVLTCREVDFQQQPQLAQDVIENLVVRVNINPLDEKYERNFVERYIKEQDANKKWRHTAGQVMEVINHSRLLDHFHHRSEEHTSELQSRVDLVCRLLLEKKKKKKNDNKRK